MTLTTCVLLLGCGSSASVTTNTRTQEAKAPALRPGQVEPKHAKAACEGAVKSAPLLTSAAKTEIAALCFRINQVLEDNEKTVRSVCQEVVIASAPASAAARTRTFSACYAAGMR